MDSVSFSECKISRLFFYGSLLVEIVGVIINTWHSDIERIPFFVYCTMANDEDCGPHKTQSSSMNHTSDIPYRENYPQLYFPTHLFTPGKYSPMLYFNVTTQEVNPEYIRHYELSGPIEEAFSDHPARITIHCVPNRLSLPATSEHDWNSLISITTLPLIAWLILT